MRAQTLNLLQDLQDEFGLTYLFVSHDLSVVEHISDHVAVMYVGRVVEFAPTEALFAKPRHPYTEALLSAMPQPDPPHARPTRSASGCAARSPIPRMRRPAARFHPRCRTRPISAPRVPPLRELGDGRRAACHYAEELDLRGVA